MEDAKIIALYFARDEKAIAHTDAKYGRYCYSIAQNILCSHPDSEECVSDTWLRAWNAIPPHKPSRLRLFLGRITRNLSVDRFRSWNSEKRGGGEATLALEELRECVSAQGDPARELELQELQAAIGRFLEQLPRREQGIFLRRYFYAESTAQIAKRYEVKDSHVRLILSRTREKLRNQLKKEGFLE